MTPAAYLQDGKDSQGRNICKVMVYGNTRHASEFILGDVFMQSLYVILDYENSRFAVNGAYTTVTALDDKPYRPPTDPETPTDPKGSLVWIIIGSVVAILVIVAVVGFLIVHRKNRRLQDNLAKYETL